MNLRKLLTLVGAVALGALAWRAGGWYGILFLVSGVVFWIMLSYTRLMTVVRRANDRPIGYVGSAVMLNAKLKTGSSLLHVIALTRSLGQRLSAEGEEPERYRWTDPGDSHVTAEFEGGKLARWQLERPAEPAAEASADAPALPPADPPPAA